MTDILELITVNERQEYHNCEMTFSCYYQHANSDFKVSKEQKYSIYTTVKEVQVLNEALAVYQTDGFKDAYLLYVNEIEPSKVYPDFEENFNKAHALAKDLSALANDEDSLVQLSAYCEEQAPTYVDDFGINKQIESITIDGKVKNISNYQDLKDYLF